MHLSTLRDLFLLMVIFTLFLVVMNGVRYRRIAKSLAEDRSLSIWEKAHRFVILGTDNDLKVELVYLIFLSSVVFLVSLLRDDLPRSVSPLPIVLAIILGFHFRQWLSRWRLRNIVSLQRLESDDLLVVKASELIGIGVNVLISAVILWVSPTYSLFLFVGLFMHEISLELRKNEKILQRRLHILDLRRMGFDLEVLNSLGRATSLPGLRKIARITSGEENQSRRKVLLAFRFLLTNDVQAFKDLSQESRDLILGDPDLCYYFGRGLYSIGELSCAEELVRVGYEEHGSVRCAAYLALTLMAQSRGEMGDSLKEAIGILEPLAARRSLEVELMLVHAYYALALTFKAGKDPEMDSTLGLKALDHIHLAIKINERQYEKSGFGKLARSHFRGNELILLDICGYIALRRGELRLAYRILQSAIISDNTYPWPYFHLALIYEAVGKLRIARSIYRRIALNERSRSVLYFLCKERLERNGSLGSKRETVG